MCDLATSFRGQMLNVMPLKKYYSFKVVCIGMNDTEDEVFVRHVEVIDRLICHNDRSSSRFQLQSRRFIEGNAKCDDKLLMNMVVECINCRIYSNNNMFRCKFPRSYPTIRNGISYNIIYSEKNE